MFLKQCDQKFCVRAIGGIALTALVQFLRGKIADEIVQTKTPQRLRVHHERFVLQPLDVRPRVGFGFVPERASGARDKTARRKDRERAQTAAVGVV